MNHLVTWPSLVFDWMIDLLKQVMTLITLLKPLAILLIRAGLWEVPDLVRTSPRVLVRVIIEAFPIIVSNVDSWTSLSFKSEYIEVFLRDICFQSFETHVV